MSDIVIITRFPADFNVLGSFWIELSQSKRTPLKKVRPCTFLSFEFCLTAKRRKYGTTAILRRGFTHRTGCTVFLSCDVLGGKPKTRVENCTQDVQFSNIYGLSSVRPSNFAFFSASVAPGTAILLSASAVV